MTPKSVKEYYPIKIPLVDQPLLLLPVLLGLEYVWLSNPQLPFLNQVLTPAMTPVAQIALPLLLGVIVLLRMYLRRRCAVRRYQADYLDVLPFARVTTIAKSPLLSKRDRKEILRYLQDTHPGWS